jgi:hypothetical protein
MTTTFTQFKKKMLKDPAVAAEYGALEPEFEFKREYVRRILQSTARPTPKHYTNKKAFIAELLKNNH